VPPAQLAFGAGHAGEPFPPMPGMGRGLGGLGIHIPPRAMLGDGSFGGGMQLGSLGGHMPMPSFGGGSNAMQGMGFQLGVLFQGLQQQMQGMQRNMDFVMSS